MTAGKVPRLWSQIPATGKSWTRNQYGESEKAQEIACVYVYEHFLLWCEFSQGIAAKCHMWSCLWSFAGDSWQQKSKHVIIVWSPPKLVHQSKGQHGWSVCPICWFLIPQLLFSVPIQLSPCINTSKIFLTNIILTVFQPKAWQSHLNWGQIRGSIPRSDPRLSCQQEKEL